MSIDSVSFEWARNEDGEKHRRISIPGDTKKKMRLISLLWDGLERATGKAVKIMDEVIVKLPKKRGRSRK